MGSHASPHPRRPAHLRPRLPTQPPSARPSSPARRAEPLDVSLLPRPVAVIAGARLPFARSNSHYAHESNHALLTATLRALVERTGLQGELLGEVVAGAVLKHPRERDLTREALLDSGLAPETPAYDLQQACATGLEAVVSVANKIALGQIEAGIAGGVDTTSEAPLSINDELRRLLLEANRTRTLAGRARLLGRFRPRQLIPEIPRNAEPRTGLSMGEHCALMAEQWQIPRSAQDELAAQSHRRLAGAYERGFLDDLVVPFNGLERDQNLRPNSTPESLARLAPAFGGPAGTITAGNASALCDGASAVLLASKEWAREHELPVLAYLTDAQAAAVDHARGGEGLLMAPAYAMPRILDRAGIGLGDFDLYEIHEAFAAQVLCTLRAWEDPVFCRERLGRESPLGEIDPQRLNVNGGSLAAGHPFAATGGRIVAAMAKALHERGGGRGVISICAAAGQGLLVTMKAPPREDAAP